jgi:uncharacterized protein (DUF305 family)
MSKNNTIIIITLAVVVLAGFGIYQFTQSNQNNSSNSFNNPNMPNMPNNMAGMMTGNNQNNEPSNDSMMMGMMNMSDLVVDDQSFIENMIPHHIEAVSSSQQVLASTSDPELKAFVQTVIEAQNKEIDAMKTWYKDWFGKDYTPNNSYQAMMGGMQGKTGIDLDKEYTKAMIMHHQGAIEMAKKIQSISKRPEILKLADEIISSQTANNDGCYVTVF